MLALSRAETVAAAVAVACVGCLAVATGNYFIDDAFIGFQYLNNLWAGAGFTFYRGTPPVEGVTNIGWLLFLGPLTHQITPHLAAKWSGAALVILSGLTVFKLAGTALFRAPTTARWIALATIVSCFEFAYFSIAGMETGFLATLLLVEVVLASRDPRSYVVIPLGAYLFLVHPEAALVVPAYLALSLWNRTITPRGVVSRYALYALCLVIISAVRYWYFEDLLPNTFSSKPGSLRLFAYNAARTCSARARTSRFPSTASWRWPSWASVRRDSAERPVGRAICS
jgi:hypothetical protein